MIDTYTLLHIVKSYYHVDNHDLHLKLKVASKKYYEYTKDKKVDEFFDANVIVKGKTIIYSVCGVMHRLYGPARIEHYSDNSACIAYYYNNKLHREDEVIGTTRHSRPAVIKYYCNGFIENKYYYIHGKCHREDDVIDGVYRPQPAHIEYYSNGTTMRETYYYYDKIHRKNGPARIEYYPNGVVKLKEYYFDDMHHCENGPAIIIYNRNGTILSKYYYVYGMVCRPYDFNIHTINYMYINTRI